MSAVQLANAGIESVKQSNILLQEAATAVRAALASLAQSGKTSATAAGNFARAASAVTSNSSSRGHVLAQRCDGRKQNIEELQNRLAAVLEPMTTMLVRGNELVADGERYRNELAR